MRPAPRPFRSARRLRLSDPVTFQSVAADGSLLVTLLIRHAGLGSLSSVTVTPIVTGTMCPFGGQRTSGDAVSAEIVGGTTAEKLGQGEGAGPVYVMHQFPSNVLRVA